MKKSKIPLALRDDGIFIHAKCMYSLLPKQMQYLYIGLTDLISRIKYFQDCLRKYLKIAA